MGEMSASTTPATDLTPQQWWEVTSPPPELAAQCAALMPEGSDPLDEHALEALVARIAETAAIWTPLQVIDADRRRYRLLYEDARIDIWVLSWMPGQGTGFHDHDLSSVGLACAQGAVTERQMLLPTGATTVEMSAGTSRRGGPGYIHSVAHCGGEPAITIHAYSPPLERVGQYRVDEAGVLRRSVEHGRPELLDNTIAEIDPGRA
jgi:predicted metal-dependent enzyme (double-stranded beta helix superfamily)